ncbi:MAG: choice-of-anchor A family protein, partial [Chitinophagaceae bacterium]
FGVVIAGKMAYNSGGLSRVLRGQIRLANAIGTTVWYANGSAVNTKLTASGAAFTSTPALQAARTQTVGSVTSSTGLDIAAAFVEFMDYNARINTWRASTDPRINHIALPAGPNPTITLVADRINYMNVTRDQLSGINSSLTLAGAPLAANTILVVNVNLGQPYVWSPPNMSSLPASAGSFIVWNFYNASTLQINGNRAVYGTVLAPTAALNFSNNNGAFGQLIARSLTLGNALIRYQLFSSTLPDVPEAIILPLRSISLSGALSGSNVDLQWEVIDEVAIAEYGIERSSNGTDFTEVGVVPSSGDHSRFTYRFSDVAPDLRAPLVYYRIAVRERDGSHHFSAVKAVKQVRDGLWKLWPNPVTDRLHLRYWSGSGGAARIRLLGPGGQLLRDEPATLQTGLNQVTLAGLLQLAPGAYYVELLNERGERLGVERIIK